LDNNQIQSLSPTVKNLTKLEQLWLSGNFLRQLPTKLGQLTSLIELHLGRNKIHHVPPELGNLNRLVSLNLSYNRLTISQQFAQAIGGEIGVENQLGQGSTFWFELSLEHDLPDQQPEAKKAEPIKRVGPTDLSGKRGLVVDDDLVNRIIGRKHLENLGGQVDEAVDVRIV